MVRENIYPGSYHQQRSNSQIQYFFRSSSMPSKKPRNDPAVHMFLCQSVMNIFRRLSSFHFRGSLPFACYKGCTTTWLVIFLYHFYYVINLFLSWPVIHILTKANLILSCLTWKSLCDAAVATLCVDRPSTRIWHLNPLPARFPRALSPL